MNVALITNIAPPYRLPTWNALAERVGKLHVLFSAAGESNRIWENAAGATRFVAHPLPGKSWHVASRDWGLHWNPGISKILRDIAPSHVLVTGYETPTYLAAIRFARRRRIPLTMWWGSHAGSSRSRGGIVAALRRRIVTRADSFVTYGSRATAALRAMDVPAERIVTGCNTVDVAGLGKLVDAQRVESPGPVRFLYVGQFIERKGVRELLAAFATLPGDRATLTLVGYGPMESELRRIAGENVFFAGATKTVEETARHYANADVLVMPSHLEVWGLVVNEALAAGLYVLASLHAGATPDLIGAAPVEVGRAFGPEDEINFRDTLAGALDAPPDRAQIAAWGRSHTPEHYADAIARALERTRR